MHIKFRNPRSQLPPRDVVGRLVQRVLSSVQTLHLNELSDRKRADSISARLAITQHCQLEKDYVADFLARDLQQFGSNLKAKLLAECEIHLARERREFLEEVDACVEQKVLGGGLGESEIENEIILLVIIAKKITIDTFRENS